MPCFCEPAEAGNTHIKAAWEAAQDSQGCDSAAPSPYSSISSLKFSPVPDKLWRTEGPCGSFPKLLVSALFPSFQLQVSGMWIP